MTHSADLSWVWTPQACPSEISGLSSDSSSQRLSGQDDSATLCESSPTESFSYTTHREMQRGRRERASREFRELEICASGKRLRKFLTFGISQRDRFSNDGDKPAVSLRNR